MNKSTPTQVTFVGSCQMESLAWYFAYLLPDAEINYFPFSHGKGHGEYNGFWHYKKFELLKNRNAFTKKFVHNTKLWEPNSIHRTQEYDDYISSSDLVIYQVLSTKASPKYYKQRLESLISKDATRFKLPAFHIDRKNIDETLQGMRNRCDVNNTDIHIDDILKNVSLDSMINVERGHPKAIYFLEVARLLCLKLGIDFLVKKIMQCLQKQAFPSDNENFDYDSNLCRHSNKS